MWCRVWQSMHKILNFSVLFCCLEGFSLIWRRHHYQEMASNLTYARHSWSLSSEGSLAWHTNCDTWQSFIWSSPRTRDTHTCCRLSDSGAATTCFNRSVPTRGIEPRPPACQANNLPLHHRCNGLLKLLEPSLHKVGVQDLDKSFPSSTKCDPYSP